MTELLHHLIENSASRSPHLTAIRDRGTEVTYGRLAEQVSTMARALVTLGVGRGERVGVYLDKRVETVVSMFGSAAAGAVFVPLNSLLKNRQVAYILKDCNVRVLVTSADRLRMLASDLAGCVDLRAVVVTDGAANTALGHVSTIALSDILASGAETSASPHRVIDVDMAAILYTSGSTGMPKGVVLSHRNLVAGANSVSQYLRNDEHDRILSVLPLSFDAGLSQLTTAFSVGASVVLLNYLLPQDVVRQCSLHRITGITAVPALWLQLGDQAWPPEARESVRYFANTGGHMPRPLLQKLRAIFPGAKPYLMYGLTEAFRSTYLDPAEVDRRIDSIGKAIPNAEILVVRGNGELCQPGEEGELVHRGALVAGGYWNDPERTAERFRPAPGRPGGTTLTEIAVWSGDIVRADEDGFLYFVGRRDEMIKTSGYRVSPTEIEDAIYATGLVAEAVAFGVPHPALGQAVVAVVVPKAEGPFDSDGLLTECRRSLPLYMTPSRIEVRTELPRNANGKLDRKSLATELGQVFVEAQ